MSGDLRGDLRDDVRAQVSGDGHARADEARRVLIVRVGAERVALPLAAVRELVDAPSVMPVPMAPAALRGHCALRGQHLAVLDLAQLLQIPGATDGVPVALVLASGECALAVDDAEDVWAGDELREQPLPAGGDGQGLVRGLLRRDGAVALLVDADALDAVAVATLQRASSQ